MVDKESKAAFFICKPVVGQLFQLMLISYFWTWRRNIIDFIAHINPKASNL